MIAAVKRLPEPAQKVLAMAACFGPVAPLPVLAAAGDQDQGQALAALAPAIEAGLVVVGGLPVTPPRAMPATARPRSGCSSCTTGWPAPPTS